MIGLYFLKGSDWLPIFWSILFILATFNLDNAKSIFDLFTPQLTWDKKDTYLLLRVLVLSFKHLKETH